MSIDWPRIEAWPSRSNEASRLGARQRPFDWSLFARSFHRMRGTQRHVIHVRWCRYGRWGKDRDRSVNAPARTNETPWRERITKTPCAPVVTSVPEVVSFPVHPGSDRGTLGPGGHVVCANVR